MTISIVEDFNEDQNSSKYEGGAVDYSKVEDIDLFFMMAHDPEAAKEYISRHGERIRRQANEAS